MRYHFVSFSNESYDPSASYVLKFLKNKLTEFRTNGQQNDYSEVELFINSYINSLKAFFVYCKKVIEKAKTNPEYFKLFVILNLSATLYPLIVKLEEHRLLDTNLGNNRNDFNFFDLVELIEVRVYKTRATDPKADIARFVYEFDKKTSKEIEDWLVWFNQRWMSKEEFRSNLSGSVYGNRALIYIFICYCEKITGEKYSIDSLKKIVEKNPNIEHILSQTPKFSPKSLKFRNVADFIEYEHRIGNLTILEKKLNSSVQNKNAIDKVDAYGKSLFKMTKKLASEIDTNKGFAKIELNTRTDEIVEYCIQRWWCN